MARCCNSLLQKAQGILKSPTTWKGEQLRHKIQLQHPIRPRQRASEDALLSVKQKGKTAEPELWAGRPEVQSTVMINDVFHHICYWLDATEKGLAVPCGVEIGQHHLRIHYVSRAHHRVSDPQHTSRKKHYACKKMLEGFIMSHLTFPVFLIDCSCHQGLTKCIILLAFAAQQQVQILAPLASFGGPALWFRK